MFASDPAAFSLSGCKSGPTGLVCRLFKPELEYIINHAEDQFIMLDPVFIDLMVQLQSRLPTVKGFIILTDRQHMTQQSKLKNMHCYEDLLQASWKQCQPHAHRTTPLTHPKL